MSIAARVGDVSNHPGSIMGPGIPTVLIGGMPAAVLGDLHACSFPSNPPHPPGTIVQGSATVMIGKKPAARVGDAITCGASIMSGAFDVLIGG